MSQRRFTRHFDANPDAKGLAPDHPAVIGARTIFPSKVVNPKDSPRVLVSGHNQRKIGKVVEKGRWRGMPIFVLTLEERATCPSSCHHWLDCYGNTSHMSRRHTHGADLEAVLAEELAAKQTEFPAGFVVRVHQLGDFYDEAYVMLWRRWLAAFQGLRIFGYTARPIGSLIGALVDTLNADFGDRAYIRFSGPQPTPGAISAITIPDASHPTEAIICPAQLDKTDCCATCGLCWTTEKTIAFLQHGGFTGGGWTEEHRGDQPSVSDRDWKPAPVRVADEVFVAHRKFLQRPPQRPAFSVPAGLYDAGEIVPLRPIEARAWLRGILGAAALDVSDADLLEEVNRHRALHFLPKIRLIPSHESSRRFESIMTHEALA